MRVERGEGYVVLHGAAAPGASATTLGPLIFVAEGAKLEGRLLRHELGHVRQYRELGYVRFFFRYLRAYARWRAEGYPHWGAYRRIPLEIEAEWGARHVPAGAAIVRARGASA